MTEDTGFTVIKGVRKCPWCDKAIELLDDLGHPYSVRTRSLSELRRDAYVANMSTVPIIYHGVKLVGGYDNLVAYLETLK